MNEQKQQTGECRVAAFVVWFFNAPLSEINDRYADKNGLLYTGIALGVLSGVLMMAFGKAH